MTTPHFELCHPEAATRVSLRPSTKAISSRAQAKAVAITGSDDSRRRTYSRPRFSRDEDDEGEDVVSWSSLLAALHDYQQLQLPSKSSGNEASVATDPRGLPTPESQCTVVCIRPKSRSWDLMPPDVVRPMASTTLGTLISMAHRMGMVWMDLAPRDGKLRAEGPYQSLSATLMRGMGIVVEYNEETTPRPYHLWRRDVITHLHVPSIYADKVRYCYCSFSVYPRPLHHLLTDNVKQHQLKHSSGWIYTGRCCQSEQSSPRDCVRLAFAQHHQLVFQDVYAFCTKAM